MTEISNVSGLRGVREAQIAMRDACFSDMIALIKICHEAVPAGTDGKEALAALYESAEEKGVEGFGAALSLPPSPQAPDEREHDLEIMLGYVIKGRCAVCGWPVAASANEGCVQGNCSFRPQDSPFRATWRRRAKLISELSVAAPAGAQGQVQGAQARTCWGPGSEVHLTCPYDPSKASVSQVGANSWGAEIAARAEFGDLAADVSSQAGQAVTRMEDGGAMGSHYVAPSAGSGQELRELAERIVMAMYFPHGVFKLNESAHAREQAKMVEGLLLAALLPPASKPTAEHDGYYLRDRWMPCRESCPACKLRNAASKFGARVFERYPDWQQETGTDLAEARDRLTAALLAQPSLERESK